MLNIYHKSASQHRTITI